MSASTNDRRKQTQGPRFATINGAELSPGAAQVVRDSINRPTDKELKKLSERIPIIDNRATAIRSHLLNAVETATPLHQAIVDVLKRQVKAVEILGLFSESLINQLYLTWPVIFGQHAAGLALAIDARPELHTIANRTFRAKAADFTISIPDCRDAFLSVFAAPLQQINVELYGRISDEPQDPLRSDSAEEQRPAKSAVETGTPGLAGELARDMIALENQVTSLKAQLKSERLESERAKVRQERERQEFQAAGAEKNNRIGQLEAADGRAHEREQALQEGIRALESERDTEVKRRLEVELSRVMRPWLAEALELEKMSATRTDLELKDRVKAILEAQQALNMKYGSRTRLRSRLADFEKYAVSIQNVFHDSLKPHPELSSLLDDVRVEIRSLGRQLGEAAQQSAFVTPIKEVIDRSENREELTEAESLITQLSEKGLSSFRETKSLFKALDVARNRLEMLEKQPCPQDGRRSGWELKQVLARNQTGMVYIDGNSVLHQLDELYQPPTGGNSSRQAARETLVSHVVRMAQRCPNVQFRVVFDDYTRSEQALTSNVVVELSGGTGADRADSAIVLHLARAGNPAGSFVVTEDRKFRAQATKLGAVYVSVGLWHLLLEELGAIPRFEEQTVTAD